jgi:hypothetical protein
MAIGIRDYLKNKYGVSDADITYNNGTVMLKNRPYIYATPEADSKTYADPNQLAMADNNYAMQEALQQYKQRISQPIQQFSYDPNSDPAYQSALQQARQNAQTAGNNAMVALGSRGIGNSSITSDRVAQIQQREYGNVVNNVLPQLIQQAYQRYLGQQQLENQQNANLLNLANLYNTQNQQLFSNDLATQQAALAKKKANLDAANQAAQITGYYTGPKEDWGLLYNTEGAAPTIATKQLAISQQNADTQRAEAEAMARYREAEAARQYALANNQANAANASTSLARQKYLDEQNQRDVEAQVAEHAQEFQSAQDVNDYFKANGAYLTKILGAAGVKALQQQYLAPFLASDKSSASGYDRALSLAQKDPRWIMPNADKKALIKEYQDLLSQE